MTDDRKAYQRAAGAALIGMGVQAALTVAIALSGLWSNLAALNAATFHLLGGLPIWIILWMLYNQHRLERIEALEAEQLAQADTQTARLFEQHADDLQLAQRRLNNLYRWGLGIVSFVVAIYLITLGTVWLWLNTRSPIDAQALAALNPLVLLTICLATSFVAFITARFVAGMTRVHEWQLLRGGASYLMGNALIGGLGAIAAFGAWLKVPGIWQVLAVIVPLTMLLIGIEIILTFLLSVYRPRRLGEIPRPAFDSRVLGLTTSPESIAKAISDTINYQFGFEVSRSWFYQLLARAITPLIICGVAVLILLSSIVIVDPYEQAIITRFGHLMRKVDPGIHLKWPWPASRAELYPVGRIHEVSIGSVRATTDPTKALLWTTQHSPDVSYLITGPTPLATHLNAHADKDESKHDVPGMALVEADIIVQFRVRDLELFARNAAAPQQLLTAKIQQDRWARMSKRWEDAGRNGPNPTLNRQPIEPSPTLKVIGQRRANAYFAQQDIDTLLAKGRMLAGETLKQQIQADVDEQHLGLEIVFVGLAGIHPPMASEVAKMFHEQINALQQEQSMIEEARTQEISLLTSAAGTPQKALEIYTQITAIDQVQRQIDQRRESGDQHQQAELKQRKAQLEQTVNQILLGAGGEASQKLYEALAYRWRLVINEQAEIDLFKARTQTYQHVPHYYRARLYLDTLAKGIAPLPRKMIVPVDPELRFEVKTVESTLGSLLGNE